MVTSESFETFAAEWAALHASVPGATVFQHPAWYRVWLRHFPAGAVVFLSVRVDEALVGVMPLDLGPGGPRALGDPNVQDYTGLLMAPGFEQATAEGLLEWLWEDMTPGVTLWGIPEDSLLPAAFEAAAARLGWTFASEEEAVSPCAALPGDWEAFVASLGKHDRHELRRKLRNLESAGDVRFDRVTDPAAVAAGMETLLAMMRASHEGKGEFLTPAMEAFFRDLAPALAAEGEAWLGTLSLDGAPAAMLLGFENDSTTFLYNSGFDPAHGHLAVGLLSKAYAIRSSIERGKTLFDFLRGAEDYKRRLGGHPHRVLTLRLSSGR